MSASAAARDPFTLLKDRISDSIKKVLVDFDKWKTLLIKDATSSEFNEILDNLKKYLDIVEKDVNKGNTILSGIKSKRNQFAHINDKELAERESFLKDMSNVISSTRLTLVSPDTNAKINSDKKKNQEKNRMKKDNKYSALDQQAQQKNQQFINQSQEQVLAIHNEQDLVLEDMATVLKSINVMAKDMGEEMEDQKIMLDRLNQQADAVNDSGALVISKLQALLQTKDNGKLCVIGVLAVILIILIFIVICMILY